TLPPIGLRGGLREARRRPDVTLLLLGAFLFAMAHNQQFVPLQTYALTELDLDLAELGLVYSMNAIGVLVLQVPAVAMIARVSPWRAQRLAALLYLVAFLLLDRADGPAPLAPAVLVITPGEVLRSPAQPAGVAELGDPARMGRAFGALGTVQLLGVALAPVVGGLAFDHARGSMWAL